MLRHTGLSRQLTGICRGASIIITFTSTNIKKNNLSKSSDDTKPLILLSRHSVSYIYKKSGNETVFFCFNQWLIKQTKKQVGCSPVQRIPTGCGMSGCDPEAEASPMRRIWPTRGFCTMVNFMFCATFFGPFVHHLLRRITKARSET